MRKGIIIALAMFFSLFGAQAVMGATLDYDGAIEKLNEEDELVVLQNVADTGGNIGKMVIVLEPAYTQAATLSVKESPSADSKTIKKLSFGQKVSRVGVCDNGWSKVLVKNKAGDKVYGYVESYYLSDLELLTELEEELTVTEDSEVLDFPGVRNGLSVGNVTENELVTCTGVCTNEWSRIVATNDQGEEVTGFVQNSILSDVLSTEEETEVVESNAVNADGDDGYIKGEAILKPGDNGSLWARAADEVTEEVEDTVASDDDVLVGSVEEVSDGATLTPLGTFKLTFYCPCSICCGPYTNGITSTGVTAQTNHTIAVDPSQIPYGSKVVINDQIYVAEDCGGAITENRIDIYVATHEEADALGVQYAEVYLLNE